MSSKPDPDLNPDPNPKLSPKPDPDPKKITSDPQHWVEDRIVPAPAKLVNIFYRWACLLTFYRLPTKENNLPFFVVSVCKKQMVVCRFRFQFAANNGIFCFRQFSIPYIPLCCINILMLNFLKINFVR